MPYMAGPLKLSMGERCRLSTQCSLLARVNGSNQPELIIGNNVGIGWQVAKSFLKMTFAWADAIYYLAFPVIRLTL